MFKTIERLQKKPESSRRAIALGTAFGITCLIIVVWLSTLGVRLDSDAQAQVSNAPSPFESFRESARGIFSGTVEFQRQQFENNAQPTAPTSTQKPYENQQSGSTTSSIASTTEATTTDEITTGSTTQDS